MKKIKVPEGMIKAALNDAEDSLGYLLSDKAEGNVESVLQVALLWLSEHPQVPTDEQIRQITVIAKEKARDEPWSHSGDFWAGFYMVEWQRRCFVQEEPEIPEEIKDLQEIDWQLMHQALYKESILEAYRRGLRKGEQK